MRRQGRVDGLAPWPRASRVGGLSPTPGLWAWSKHIPRLSQFKDMNTGQIGISELSALSVHVCIMAWERLQASRDSVKR